MKEFPYQVKLKDTRFEYDYNKFKEVHEVYTSKLRKLNSIEYDATKPISCKNWTKCYFYGDEPSYKANMWTEINDFIQEHEKLKDWNYSHIHEEAVDVNDPYDEYEHLSTKYTVYAYVKGENNFKESEQYQTQYEIVKGLYNELISLKSNIDCKLNKGDTND